MSLHALRDSNDIQGLLIPGHGESKGAAFADDTVSYLAQPSHVPNLLALLNRLRSATGLAFHPGKSWLMGPESFRQQLLLIYPSGLPFKWVPDDEARLYLGAFIHRDESKGDRLTWERRITKFHGALRVWDLSKFSHKDRAGIVNSFCVSSLSLVQCLSVRAAICRSAEQASNCCELGCVGEEPCRAFG